MPVTWKCHANQPTSKVKLSILYVPMISRCAFSSLFLSLLFRCFLVSLLNGLQVNLRNCNNEIITLGDSFLTSDKRIYTRVTKTLLNGLPLLLLFLLLFFFFLLVFSSCSLSLSASCMSLQFFLIPSLSFFPHLLRFSSRILIRGNNWWNVSSVTHTQKRIKWYPVSRWIWWKHL